eukprot:scaffold7857_cov471-Prasinococcus_capsulatus_cf.AAC.2
MQGCQTVRPDQKPESWHRVLYCEYPDEVESNVHGKYKGDCEMIPLCTGKRKRGISHIVSSNEAGKYPCPRTISSIPMIHKQLTNGNVYKLARSCKR